MGMTNEDRLKEIEKIANTLGIGQNREVKCFGCKKTIKFKNAITLTDKKKVTYLCKDCYKKLKNGNLNKSQIDGNDILKELEKARKMPEMEPAHYLPRPIPWTPETDKWNPPYTIGDKIETTGSDLDRYTVSSMECTEMKDVSNLLLKFESKNKHDYKTNSTTNR